MGKKRSLKSLRIDALPIVNAYMENCRLPEIFSQFVPPTPHMKVPPAETLLFLLRNIMLSRFPLYKLAEWGRNYLPEQRGISEAYMAYLNDDRIGRSLDLLFLADRSTMCTSIALGVIKRYRIMLKSCHNDSTTISFSGKYRRTQKFAKEPIRLKRGNSKDHRPDLKQLVFNLVVSSDGAVPIHFRLHDGNVTDDTTHRKTWELLRELVGRADFIYVADSKLCTKDNMGYIDGNNGLFITVMPKTRDEYKKFIAWVEEHPVRGHALWYRNAFPNSTLKKDHYRGYESTDFVSREGYRIIWIRSAQKKELDEAQRKNRIKRVEAALHELCPKLNRYSLQGKKAIRARVENILEEHRMGDLFAYEIARHRKYTKKQLTRGRPGPNTRYKSISTTYHQLKWSVRKDVLEKKANADGIFPLITNIKGMKMGSILKFYKYQPFLEKRHSVLKSVLDVAPVDLKTPERIEALLFLYYQALMLYALIERDMQKAMKKRKIKSLRIYPEKRECRKPSAERILEVFQHFAKHDLYENDRLVEVFYDPLNELQNEILGLLKIPVEFYCNR
jgi:transposase